jgi:ABC-type nickel/cobalt efflux system permease component RcnA
VVLLSAIAVHRVAAGLLFIVALSVGLAFVLVAIGILVVRASKVMSRFDSDRTVVRFVPVISAAIISVLGLGMAFQAVAGSTWTGAGLVLTGQAIAVLSLGLFLGLKHATDADHVVAVTTFVSQESSILRSCWIGAFWGIGHTLSLAIAGILVIGLKVNFPEWLSERLELGVAAMLVLLGANVIVRTFARRQKSQARPCARCRTTARHDHCTFIFPHSPSLMDSQGLRPLLTGMVHGAAGSWLSCCWCFRPSASSALPLHPHLGFGSILRMFAISFLLAIPLHWATGG